MFTIIHKYFSNIGYVLMLTNKTKLRLCQAAMVFGVGMAVVPPVLQNASVLDSDISGKAVISSASDTPPAPVADFVQTAKPILSHQELCERENGFQYPKKMDRLFATGAGLMSAVLSVKENRRLHFDVVHAQKENVPFPPASLTKLKTAYRLFELLSTGDLSLDEMIVIPDVELNDSKSAYNTLKVGQSYPAETLIKLMISQSNNLATHALVVHVSGSEEIFVHDMNLTSEFYCMNQPREPADGLTSAYKTASGLPSRKDIHEREENKTAKEMLILAARLYADFPDTERIKYSELLKHDAVLVDGKMVKPTRVKTDTPPQDFAIVKTGTVGLDSVSMCNSLVTAEKLPDGRLFISVVMCEPSRNYAHALNQWLYDPQRQVINLAGLKIQ